MKNRVLIMILLIVLINNIQVHKKKHKKTHHSTNKKTVQTETGCPEGCDCQACQLVRLKKSKVVEREQKMKADIARVEQINKVYQYTKVKQMIEQLRMKQKMLQNYQIQNDALNQKEIILKSKNAYADYKLNLLKQAQFDKENQQMFIKDQQLAEQSQAEQKEHQRKRRLRKHKRH